jgi:hypothetical protein
MVLGFSLLFLGVVFVNTMGSHGRPDGALYSGLGLVGIGLVIGTIGTYMLLKEYRARMGAYESMEIGGRCLECDEPYSLMANYCMKCGEPLG